MTMQFTDFPPCKHRFGCIQCRNDAKFVEHMKNRFGEWECPEKIPFGTTLDKMPPHIQAKISSYQNRLEEQGKEPLPQIKRDNKIGKRGFNVPPSPNPQNFTQTPGCVHRMMCVDCRNNENFRKRVEKQMGPWNCPENIPIGTTLENMPKHIQDNFHKREEQKRIQQEKIDKVKIALDSIEQVIPEQALGLLDEVRTHVFPNTPKAPLCKFNTGETVEVEEKCCGGKVKVVTGFVCEKKGPTSEKTCRSCRDFESKR